VLTWQRIWEERRLRCIRQDEVAEFRDLLPVEALAILEDARALASLTDPAAHAAADVKRLVDRLNALEERAALYLHAPVSNGLTMLKIAAGQLVALREGERPPAAGSLRTATVTTGAASRGRFAWLLVVGESEEVVELTRECASALRPPVPVHVAATLEGARTRLGQRGGVGLVVANLTLASIAGPGPHGLVVAAEAYQRRHATLLVTGAGDYLRYWPRLTASGLTGHDVIVKTRHDFAERLHRRLWEIAYPAPLTMSYEEDTGHLLWIGDVEVSRLEGQEALVLRALDSVWQSPQLIADACGDTQLAPRPSAVPPLISALRRKLARAMVDAESPSAQGQVIESRPRPGLPTQYRLAPWLRWEDPPHAGGAAPSLPPVLVIEDDRDWSRWVTEFLRDHGWTASGVATAAEALRRLASPPLPIVVADLSLRDPGSGRDHPDVGMRLVEDIAEQHQGARVVVLSAYGRRDTLQAGLFQSGVRTVDVIDKAAGRIECGAMLLASLQRAADELWRGVIRGREDSPGHRVVRRARRRVEVDGRPVGELSPREACLLDELIRRPNQAVKAELLEALCFESLSRTHAPDGYNALNKVHLTVRRMRQKIDRAIGTPGVGADVIRTPHRGARTAYELHGLVTDLAGPSERD